MWVCEKCHEVDRELISCYKPTKSHRNEAFGECDVCGKVVEVGFTCELYEIYTEEVRKDEHI